MLKRSPLTRKSLPNRKAPLKRSAPKPGRKSGLAPRSKKRRKQDAEVNDLAEFAALFIDNWGSYRMSCWLCGEQRATEVHHICNRASKLRHHRCNLSALCDRCHREAVEVIRPEGMFFFKQLRDPEGFTKSVMRELLRAKGLGNGRVAS